jgi:nucleoside triphosphatase
MQPQIFPEPIVGAIIINDEGKVLLLKSHKWKDMYIIPGGHIELGETIEGALIREVKEETGLDIFDIDFLDFQESIFHNKFFIKRHFIFLDFVCKTKGNNVVLDNEAENYLWASIENVFELPLVSNTKVTLQKYFDKQAMLQSR